MHPVTLNVNWLAEQVMKKLERAEITPETLQVAVDEVCAHEAAQVRARVADEVRNIVGLEKGTWEA